MHYIGYVFLEKPTDEALDEAMAPFGPGSETSQNWDWFRAGGRWDGFFEGQEEMDKRGRDHGFNFGAENEQISKNCIQAKYLLSRNEVPYFFVFDGKWFTKEMWDDDAPSPYKEVVTGAFVPTPDYEARYRSTLAENLELWVVVVDAHN